MEALVVVPGRKKRKVVSRVKYRGGGGRGGGGGTEHTSNLSPFTSHKHHHSPILSLRCNKAQNMFAIGYTDTILTSHNSSRTNQKLL